MKSLLTVMKLKHKTQQMQESEFTSERMVSVMIT